MAELKKKIKDEQIRVREEVSMEYNQRKGSNWLPLETWCVTGFVCFQRHKEYVKMLKERNEALGELRFKVCG